MIDTIATQQIVNRFSFTNASKDELWISKVSYDKEKEMLLLFLKAKYREYRRNLEIRQAEGLNVAIRYLEKENAKGKGND
jgi:hypothetical protein